ncbi:MAG TPA: hypothetical protein VKU19_13580 [Bryobacteraceae bacterium]|nr:hypothetical protein [Bryobacteraceae bacterium]
MALAAGAAYAFSFAIDLLIGGLIGVYPSTAFLPVVTWSVISGLLLLAARAIVADRLRWLAIPYVLFGILATLGALVGTHFYSFGVAGLLFVHASVVWKAGQQKSAKQKGPLHASFPIGPYCLDAPIDGIVGLREFSLDEYAVMGRQFEGERNYNARPVEFLGRKWNLMLGTVNGRIYKIAPFLEAQRKEDATPIAMATLRYCSEILGKPASQKTGLFAWDTSDGNTILQTAVVSEGLAINLFITSRSVRNFRRV